MYVAEGKSYATSCATRPYIGFPFACSPDPSFASWHAQAYEGPVFTCRSEVDHIKIVDLTGELAEQHDLVLVDTAGFESLTAASAVGMADFVLITCVPDRGSVRETMRAVHQVASLSKAARRSIPYSVLLTRWKPRGLSERAALDSLRDEGLTLLMQTLGDMAEFTKLSFSGVMPVTGKVGEQAGRLIEELAGKGAIPLKGLNRLCGKEGRRHEHVQAEAGSGAELAAQLSTATADPPAAVPGRSPVPAAETSLRPPPVVQVNFKGGVSPNPRKFRRGREASTLGTFGDGLMASDFP